MDIRVWLEGLGLGQYAANFADNDIDEAALRALTTDDLRELGVASLGHRKRLQEAIRNLPAKDASAARPDADRRQVAVLFADLTGFTQLSASVDPEEVRRIVDGFLSRTDAIVAEFGGTVDKHIGDATMAVFGAPIAHEDDAFRAVAAADALQRAMPALSAELGHALTTHIGVALGEVVAGDVGGDVRRDYTVLGDTVNLAARLVDAAGAGETLLSDPLWLVLGGRVRATPVGERRLKGIAVPQRLWRLDGLDDAVASPHRLPFVGRDLEIAQARAVIDAARPGAAIHLRGEAGIGKSRVLGEILSALTARGFAPIGVQIVDFGAARRQAPLRALVEALLAYKPLWLDDPSTPARLRAAAYDVIERPLPPELAAPYRAMEDRARAAARGETAIALAAAVSDIVPLAVAVEDLHWADEQVRALARELVRLAARSRVVVLMTARPENDPVNAAFRRDLAGAALGVIELGPLPRNAMERLARAATERLDRQLVDRFVERSGGNPLFLEQLAQSAAESQPAALPGSIRGLVQSRLDRLARPDRAALQAASALGQRFALPALRAVAGFPTYDPRPLLDAGLLLADGDTLTFSHALIQESVYASLLGESLRPLHRRAADWFGDAEPDLSAQHLDRAGDPRAAMAYHLAATRSRQAGRLGVALERAIRGLELAATDSDVVALSRLVGTLRLDLGAPRDALRAFESALARASDDEDRGETLLGIASALRIVDDLPGAERRVDEAQAIADRIGALGLASRCHHLRGNLLFPQGRVDACMEQHRAALALAERAQSPELVARALGGLGDALYAQGRMRSTRDVLDRCIQAARDAGAGAVEIANRPMAAWAAFFMLDHAGLRESAATARRLAQQAGNRRAELIALHGLMLAAIESEDAETGLPLVEDAQRIVHDLEAWRFEGENLIFGAQLEAIAGRHDRAVATARKAVDLCLARAPTYFGAMAAGIGASLTDDAAERDDWLARGEALLAAPTLGHNHLFFRRYATDTALAAGRPEDARRQGHALTVYAAAEPMPYTDLVSRRALLLADAAEGRLTSTGRADLSEMAGRAERLGFFHLARSMREPRPAGER